MPEAGPIPTPVNREPDANRDPLLGTTLLKRYEVIEQIGTGRFSVVYKARQLLMNRIVAIKSLKRDLLDEKEVVARFKKEARALSRLRHPNIVAVFDCFESQNGRPYLVMDYLDGMSLEDMLEKDRQISPEMAKPIFLQVCDALAHAHKQGVLHRDLKPGNMVLLAETKGNELIQLVDFGLAQVEEEVQKLTHDGECCGSPAYMSPEHCTGEPVDGRSDLYSFGVVMYEVLTGVVPFKGRTSVETMRLQVYESAPPMASVRPDLKIPDDVQKTVMKCLEKDPSKRYQTAAQLKEDVQNWGKVSRPARTLPKSLTSDRAMDEAASPDSPAQPLLTPPPAKTARVKEPHRVSEASPTTDKLKKWTETQQKASALQVPIIAGCFILVVALAIVATIKLTHQGGSTDAASRAPVVAPGQGSNAKAPGSTDQLLEEQPPTALSIPESESKPTPAASTASVSAHAPAPTPASAHASGPLPARSAQKASSAGVLSGEHEATPLQAVAPVHATAPVPAKPPAAAAQTHPLPAKTDLTKPVAEKTAPAPVKTLQPSAAVHAPAPVPDKSAAEHEVLHAKHSQRKVHKHSAPKPAAVVPSAPATPAPAPETPPAPTHRRAYQTY